MTATSLDAVFTHEGVVQPITDARMHGCTEAAVGINLPWSPPYLYISYVVVCTGPAAMVGVFLAAIHFSSHPVERSST